MNRKKDEAGNIAVQGNDIMLTGNYDKPVTISCIDIQMAIYAAKDRKMQFYTTYSGKVEV